MIINHNSPRAKGYVDAGRDKALHQGFVWEGHSYAVDTDSRVRINSRAFRVFMDPSSSPVKWRTLDKKLVVFSHQEFISFSSEMDVWVEQQYIQAWKDKDKLQQV